MKAEWRTENLGDICDVLDYKRKPITKRDRIAGEYPYYGATGILDYVEGFLFDEKLVLVGEDGAKWASGESTAFAVEGKYWVNNHAHVLRPHRDVVLDNWMIYFLNHSDLSEFVSGLTVPKLNQGSLCEIPIPLAPLNEQERIVGILDDAFDGIATAKANAEKNLQNARALFESHLQAVLTRQGGKLVEKPLGTFASFRNGINYTKDSKGERVKIIGVKDFQKKYWIPADNLDTVMIDGELNEIDTLKRGDILTVRSNGNPELIGRCMIMGEVSEKISFSGFTIRIRLLSPDMLPQYLCHFMKCPSSRKQLTDSGTGTNIKSLNQQTLSSLVIPIPLLSEQKTIITKLESASEEIKRLESVYRRKLAALDELKKSLLHKAFTGEL